MLVSAILSAASREFAAARPERADAFLRLLRRVGSHTQGTWRRLARMQLRFGHLEAAGVAFGHAAAFRPRDAALQAQLARICLMLDDIPAFEGYLGRALALDRDHPATLELLAEVNRDHGDPALAAALFTRLLRNKPRCRAYQRSLAQCHCRLGPAATALNLLSRRRTEASVVPSIPLFGPIPGLTGMLRADPASPGGFDAGTSVS